VEEDSTDFCHLFFFILNESNFLFTLLFQFFSVFKKM